MDYVDRLIYRRLERVSYWLINDICAEQLVYAHLAVIKAHHSQAIGQLCRSLWFYQISPRSSAARICRVVAEDKPPTTRKAFRLHRLYIEYISVYI